MFLTLTFAIGCALLAVLAFNPTADPCPSSHSTQQGQAGHARQLGTARGAIHTPTALRVEVMPVRVCRTGTAAPLHGIVPLPYRGPPAPPLEFQGQQTSPAGSIRTGRGGIGAGSSKSRAASGGTRTNGLGAASLRSDLRAVLALAAWCQGINDTTTCTTTRMSANCLGMADERLA